MSQRAKMTRDLRWGLKNETIRTVEEGEENTVETKL